ncbi:MAG: hypothetical protein EB069_09550, partial [Actinobacteria bacterium]|nr:hypothetical protein [Actinomycetota bacterium]
MILNLNPCFIAYTAQLCLSGYRELGLNPFCARVAIDPADLDLGADQFKEKTGFRRDQNAHRSHI